MIAQVETGGNGGLAPRWPRIRTAGVDGLLVSFGDTLSEPANRAALAFREAVEREGWAGVEETSTSLVSAFIRFDPLAGDRLRLADRLKELVASRDWTAAPLPGGRRLWRVPTVFEGDLAPELDEAAALAGVTPEAAIARICEAPLRVQTIGFAPGQPYLGTLPPEWDIPRRTTLTDRVEVGALTVAIRQLVLFAVSTPTGWRHIGQTAFRAFRPEAEQPFVLRPGDEMLFEPVPAGAYDRLRASGPDGGASQSELA